MVRFLNGRDYEPNMLDHSKSERIRYSSPHCISFQIGIKAVCNINMEKMVPLIAGLVIVLIFFKFIYVVTWM